MHIFLISKTGVRKPSSIKISSITSPTSHCMKVDGTRPHFYVTTIQQLSHHVRIVMRHQLRLREVPFRPYILCIIREFWSLHSSLYYTPPCFEKALYREHFRFAISVRFHYTYINKRACVVRVSRLTTLVLFLRVRYRTKETSWYYMSGMSSGKSIYVCNVS